MSNHARSGRPPDKPPSPAPPPPPTWRRYLIPIGIALTIGLLFVPGLFGGRPTTSESYTAFLQQVRSGQVQSVTIGPGGAVTGTLTNGNALQTAIPTAAQDTNLIPLLQANNVEITATPPTNSPSVFGAVLSFLPLLLLVGLFVWSGRAARRQMGGMMGVGRAKAKVADMERPSTRFADVAGYDGVKREVVEVVDYLGNPERYRRAGAVGPRGVLMVGPPGTGKTLLARAVAGEASVPFFAVSGSSFVEMFVGVGAARVRDLFQEARKRSPAIVFIDEVDAIGGKRGGAGTLGGGTNDEREQTLNQLLAEMDGFETDEAAIVVLAATNRPETLDDALLRPGRFDRQVTVPLPNQKERRQILAVHSRDKRLAGDVDLDVVSRGTPGFSGADLANLVNEAAIVAVRDGREVVSAADLDAARDRLLLGRRDDSNALLPDEKVSVAVHESGHALVAALSENADPVAKVTILPSGMALGVTEQLPEAERHLYSEGYLRDSLAVRLGGRAAELVVFGQGSTGAANDLQSATDLATRMVREFGLSPELGPVGYASGSQMFLGGGGVSSRTYAEETQRRIDLEVSRLLREAEQRAVSLLHDHREALDRLSQRLLEEETVDGDAVTDALRPEPVAASVQVEGVD